MRTTTQPTTVKTIEAFWIRPGYRRLFTLTIDEAPGFEFAVLAAGEIQSATCSWRLVVSCRGQAGARSCIDGETRFRARLDGRINRLKDEQITWHAIANSPCIDTGGGNEPIMSFRDEFDGLQSGRYAAWLDSLSEEELRRRSRTS